MRPIGRGRERVVAAIAFTLAACIGPATPRPDATMAAPRQVAPKRPEVAPDVVTPPNAGVDRGGVTAAEPACAFRVDAMAFDDDNVGYATREGALFRTDDGGATWRALGMPAPHPGAMAHELYDERLTSVGRDCVFLFRVRRGDGGDGASVALDVVRSVDGGSTWRTTTLPMDPQMLRIDDVAMTSPTAGYVDFVRALGGMSSPVITVRYATRNGGVTFEQAKQPEWSGYEECTTCPARLACHGAIWSAPVTRERPCLSDYEDMGGHRSRAVMLARRPRRASDGSTIVGAYCPTPTKNGTEDDDGHERAWATSYFRFVLSSNAFSFLAMVEGDTPLLLAPGGGILVVDAHGGRVSSDSGRTWKASELPRGVASTEVVGPRRDAATSWFLRSDRGCVYRSRDAGVHWEVTPRVVP